jgi:two-component system chemotaxis sensor kinase CheA
MSPSNRYAAAVILLSASVVLGCGNNSSRDKGLDSIISRGGNYSGSTLNDASGPSGGSGGGVGGIGNATGGATAGGTGADMSGGGKSGNVATSTSSCQVATDPTPGKWHTDFDKQTGRFVFISPEGNKSVLRGISMTGMETGTRETQSGAGFWLYNSTQGNEKTNAPKVIENVIDVVANNWKTGVVRIPICGSAWTQN